jgi:hypothetical protein
MKKILFFVFALCSLATYGQTPTFSENVAPIMYAKCDYCHYSGGIAPFSLVTYQDATSQMYSITAQVENHIMPPWPPDPKYSHFIHERTLTANEQKTITDWINNGAPEGDKSKLPPMPDFSVVSSIGTPDISAKVPKYTVNSDQDVYRCFAIPVNNVDQHFISALEIVPGNKKIVHHVLVFYDTTGACQRLDNQDPEPGYSGFGGVGSNSAQLIGGWVPGATPIIYPKGMGGRLAKNAVIVLQVHYAGGNNGESDSMTTLQIRYSRETHVREVFLDPVLNHYTSMVNGPLYIPANTVKSFTERYRVPIDVSVLSVAPHMHLIGKTMKVYAIAPTKDTMPLIKIDDWDFHWQGFYAFPKLVHVKAGTTLYAEATYDNTTNNIDNPNNPPKDVSVGERTTDEMMLTYFAYMYYQPGDENIVLDTTGITGIAPQETSNEIEIYPNPAGQSFALQFNFAEPQTVNADLYSLEGKKIATLAQNYKAAGICTISCHTSSLSSGTYIVKVVTQEGGVLTKKIVVK